MNREKSFRLCVTYGPENYHRHEICAAVVHSGITNHRVTQQWAALTCKHICDKLVIPVLLHENRKLARLTNWLLVVYYDRVILWGNFLLSYFDDDSDICLHEQNHVLLVWHCNLMTHVRFKDKKRNHLPIKHFRELYTS